MLASVSRRQGQCFQGRRIRQPLERAQFLVTPGFYDSNGGKLNLGTAGSLLDVQQGSAAGADSNDFTTVTERGLRLPGVASNHGSAPDSAALSITGDIEFIVRLAPDDWASGSAQILVSKFHSTAQRSYRFDIAGDGDLSVTTSPNGATPTTAHRSTGAPLHTAAGLSDGDMCWVRATLDVDDGAGDTACTFYYSLDPTNDPDEVTWIQLGNVQTSGGTISIFDGTAALNVGGRNDGGAELVTGLISRVQVISDPFGTPVIEFDADFTKVAEGATSFTEDSANAATVTINQSGINPARMVDDPMDIFDGTDDYGEVANETKWANILKNPTAGANTTDWDAPGTNSIARVTDLAAEGLPTEGLPPGVATCFKFTYGDTATFGRYIGQVFTAAAHTMGGYFYIPAANSATLMTVHDNGTLIGATGETYNSTNVRDAWTRVVSEVTPDAGDLTGNLALIVGAGSPTVGDVVYFAAAHVELGASANDYRDGDHPLGRWTGTAHASTSESRSNLDPLTDSSIVWHYAGRTYDAQPPAVEVPIGKMDGAGVPTNSGWQMYTRTTNNLPAWHSSDGTTQLWVGIGAGGAGADSYNAAAKFVASGRINRTLAQGEAWFQGVSNGTDSGIGLDMSNNLPMRIGADGGATPADFMAGENHGVAFINYHDDDPADGYEIEMQERQLAMMSGRYF
jgi:hypothetical protein